MLKMTRFTLLALTIFLASCGSMKLTDSSYAAVTDANVERDQYVFQFKKKAGAYLEVVEVKLLNSEKGMDQSVPFQVTDTDGKKSILDVKGRDAFAVVASKPKGSDNVLASSALIAYKTDPEGTLKYYTVKKIGQ
jgi:hypothetical protein